MRTIIIKNTAMRNFHLAEITLFIVYKIVLEFYFMPLYFETYGYMFFFKDASYLFSADKFIVSTIIFLIMLYYTFVTHRSENETYTFLIRILLLIAVIPMLSVYAWVSNIEWKDVLLPTVFYILLLSLIKRDSAIDSQINELIKLPKILNIDLILLLVSGTITVVLWLAMGSPIVTTFDDAIEQRLALRAEAMPRLIGYIHVFLGGVVFPYLFAKYSEQKKFFLAIVSLIFGYLAFSINGMKTWIFLYALFLLVVIIKKIDKGNMNLRCIYTLLSCIGILLVSGIAFKLFNIPMLLGQFGRMIVIPSTIGFKSISFFRENELLLLRESVLRSLFPSPYPNGSDYFIFYGLNSTITSGRSNCGLWGDAYRNFSWVGILIYPFLYEKVFHIVIRNGKWLNETLRIFVLLLVVWNGINLSYFTWLLTGGVIVMIVLEKIERSNFLYTNSK